MELDIIIKLALMMKVDIIMQLALMMKQDTIMKHVEKWKKKKNHGLAIVLNLD